MTRGAVTLAARAAFGGLALGAGVSLAFSPPLHRVVAGGQHDQRRLSTSAPTATASDGAADGREISARGTVASIHRYPVKSCGGEQLNEVFLERLSPVPFDRAFMWVDADGKFITQRPSEPRQGNGGTCIPLRCKVNNMSITPPLAQSWVFVSTGKGVPAMATIDASITSDGTTLRLSAEGCEPLEVETTAGPEATRRECTLFSGRAKVVDQQPVIAGEWFAKFCGIEGGCLVRSDPEADSLKDDWRESRVMFQSEAFKGEANVKRSIPLDDGGCILIASQSSVDELNGRLRSASIPEVNMGESRSFLARRKCTHAS